MVKVTLVGNIASDIDLKFTQKGDAVASFSLAVNERVKQGDTWTDGEPTFYRVSVWRNMGEQTAELLSKGDRVIVYGSFKPREYETKAGGKAVSLDVTADEIGQSIRFAKTTQRVSVEDAAPF